MQPLTAKFMDVRTVPVIRLAGSLDSRNDTVLFSAFTELETKGTRHAVLDFTETEYVTAAGWGMILDRYRAWRRGGREFVLSGMNVSVRSLFNFLELRHSLPVEETATDAASRLLSMPGGSAVTAAA